MPTWSLVGSVPFAETNGISSLVGFEHKTRHIIIAATATITATIPTETIMKILAASAKKTTKAVSNQIEQQYYVGFNYVDIVWRYIDRGTVWYNPNRIISMLFLVHPLFIHPPPPTHIYFMYTPHTYPLSFRGPLFPHHTIVHWEAFTYTLNLR